MYERTYKAKVLSQKAPTEKKRRRRFPLRTVLKGILFASIAALVIVLIRLPQLQVHTVEVVGTSVVDPEDVSLFIRSKIEGNYAFIFPKRSMLLVPTASITKWTAKQFPRFAEVDVRRKGLNELIVTAVEHQGKYLWCDELLCYFMTEHGLVFAEAPVFSGDAYPRIYIGEKQELPFSPLTDTQLATVQLLLERLPSLGIHPNAFRTVSVHEVDVEFSHNGSDARLMLDPDTDTEEMLTNLATALSTEPLKGQFKTGTLEYLDARFANKVVYKFR